MLTSCQLAPYPNAMPDGVWIVIVFSLLGCLVHAASIVTLAGERDVTLMVFVIAQGVAYGCCRPMLLVLLYDLPTMDFTAGDLVHSATSIAVHIVIGLLLMLCS